MSRFSELMDQAKTPISEREFTNFETELLAATKRRHKRYSAAALMKIGLRLRNLESEVRELKAINRFLEEQRK